MSLKPKNFTKPLSTTVPMLQDFTRCVRLPRDGKLAKRIIQQSKLRRSKKLPTRFLSPTNYTHPKIMTAQQKADTQRASPDMSISNQCGEALEYCVKELRTELSFPTFLNSFCTKIRIQHILQAKPSSQSSICLRKVDYSSQTFKLLPREGLLTHEHKPNKTCVLQSLQHSATPQFQ